MRTLVILGLLALVFTYDGNKAVEYARKYWKVPNHTCGSNHLNCSPYAYFGSEACGYAGDGGDCANFVSQCLIAGGHPILKKGECRGYPCGKEEPGATRLGRCLANDFGWQRKCGKNLAPPSNIKVGDVIVYHTSSCDDWNSHAVIVSSVSGGVKITCHSNKQLDAPYTYILGSMPVIEYLLQP